MIIGVIKTPNKWASMAQAHNQPFEYSNCLPDFTGYYDSWGNSIIIDPWLETYKIISQDGFKVTEYWCVRINTDEFRHLLIPVGMKRYGYSNSQAKCFAFQSYIGDLLMQQNRLKPNFNPSMVYSASIAELILDALNNSCQWEDWSETWSKLNMSGATTLRLPSGNTTSIDFMVRRCCIVDMFGRSLFSQINEMGDLHGIGVNNQTDLLNLLYDFLPMDAMGTMLELDWIGECILTQYLKGIEIAAIQHQTIATPNSQNLMMMLTNASRTEELVDVPNIQEYPMVVKSGELNDRLTIPTSPQPYASDRAREVLECMEEIISSLMADDATTFACQYFYDTGKLEVIDRVYGYGLASKEQERVHRPTNVPLVPPDQLVDFACQRLCESLCAKSVRFIKTFNEELFVTVWYDDGRVLSFYYNLIIHMCVTGSLFSG